MEKYKIANSVYHKLPTNAMVIQNQNGVVMVNNTELISLMEYIDKNNLTEISYKDLEKYLFDNTDKAIEFLEKYGVINPYKETMNFNVNRIQLVTNNEKFEKNIMYYFDQLKVEKDLEIINNSDLKVEFNDHDLIVVFLNPYDKRLAKRIYDQVQDNGRCLLLMTYVYSSNFYIDNLYSPKWKNPCHYCHMGFIESQLRIEDNDGGLSFQGLIDILYHEDKNFSVELPISTVGLSNFLTLILNRLEKFVFRTNGNVLSQGESIEDINNTTLYDTNTGKIYTDTAIHWEMCNCYE